MQQYVVPVDYYAYGESTEAGNSPRLAASEVVTEIGPRQLQPNGYEVTFVQTSDGRIERMLTMDLVQEG